MAKWQGTERIDRVIVKIRASDASEFRYPVQTVEIIPTRPTEKMQCALD